MRLPGEISGGCMRAVFYALARVGVRIVFYGGEMRVIFVGSSVIMSVKSKL